MEPTQTIAFIAPISPMIYGSATTVALSATGGASGNPVTFSVASGPGSVLGSTLTINGSGSITVTANQAGSSNYSAASPVSQTIVVSPAASTLTGPATQPVFVISGQSGSIPVSITGQYATSAQSGLVAKPRFAVSRSVVPPSGSIAYSILDATKTSVASGSLPIASGAVSIPVASTLAPGLYAVTASYAGDANYNAATPVSIALQVGQIQPVVAITAPTGTLLYGTTLGIQATAVSGSSAVPGSFTYTATLGGGSPLVVGSGTILAAGTYTLTASFTPTDASTYKTGTATSTLTITKATPGVTLTSSVNPILVQNATTLTATVSSGAGVPTGSVSFYDNTASASLGTVALTNGVAALPTAALAVGTHSITAIYAGDSNFVTVTSAAVSEVVNDFALTISATSSGATTQTVLPGGSATYTFTISPTGTSTFPSAVNLTVSGLPTGATYTLTPSTLPAGSGATPVTLVVNVPKQTAMLHETQKLAPVAFALLLLPFFRRTRRAASRLGRLAMLLLVFAGGAAALAGLTGCGANTGFFAQQQQSCTVTITGTSGALVHSTSVTLTVQ